MAKARVTATCPECGAEYTWSVDCHNRQEADAWEARHENEERLCTACWKAARAKEREEARREAHDAAKEATAKAGKTLARLTGSDKQVAWAEDVRARTLSEVLKLNPSADPVLWDILNLETKARWWIDCEGMTGMGVLEHLWTAHREECEKMAGEAKDAAAGSLERETEKEK